MCFFFLFSFCNQLYSLVVSNHDHDLCFLVFEVRCTACILIPLAPLPNLAVSRSQATPLNRKCKQFFVLFFQDETYYKRNLHCDVTNLRDRGVKTSGYSSAFPRFILEGHFNAMHCQRRRVRCASIVQVVMRI